MRHLEALLRPTARRSPMRNAPWRRRSRQTARCGAPRRSRSARRHRASPSALSDPAPRRRRQDDRRGEHAGRHHRAQTGRGAEDPASARACPPRQQHLRRDPRHHPAKLACRRSSPNCSRERSPAASRLSPTPTISSLSATGRAPISASSPRAACAVSRSEAARSLKIEGPHVTLAPTQVIALGVVLHELGTNAAKYGALLASTAARSS